MHEVVKGKFFAFKGPSGTRTMHTLIPSDYIDVFHSKGINSVVRLNNAEYDRASFLNEGIEHHDLIFTDCSTPPDAIVDDFLRVSETSRGALAVHCLAGLGRTGTLIAMYMMKHLRFSADEAIAWLRIVRPGIIIGPQQQYLKDQQVRMWELDPKVLGLGNVQKLTESQALAATEISVEALTLSPMHQELAEMVNTGMEQRYEERQHPSSGGDRRSATPLRNSVISKMEHIERATGAAEANAKDQNGRSVEYDTKRLSYVTSFSASLDVAALPGPDDDCQSVELGDLCDWNTDRRSHDLGSPRTSGDVRKGNPESGAAGRLRAHTRTRAPLISHHEARFPLNSGITCVDDLFPAHHGGRAHGLASTSRRAASVGTTPTKTRHCSSQSSQGVQYSEGHSDYLAWLLLINGYTKKPAWLFAPK